MSEFKQKFEIVPKYVTSPSARRSGLAMKGLSFVVAHDTGNTGSTAYGNASYYERSRNDQEASAHCFIDDEVIYETVPFFTAAPERAWHVVYNTPVDNRIFGCDANDYAPGFELCYGGGIDIYKAYEKFVWLVAYACYKGQLDPATRVTGHYILDPTRKVDPVANSFKLAGVTFDEFIADVVKEYNDCTTVTPVVLGGPLAQGVIDTVHATWIEKAWYATTDQSQKAYIHWLMDMLRDASDKPLNPGVAETVINTWLSPSWYSTSDEGQKNYIHWLADQLRVSSGIY